MCESVCPTHSEISVQCRQLTVLLSAWSCCLKIYLWIYLEKVAAIYTVFSVNVGSQTVDTLLDYWQHPNFSMHWAVTISSPEHRGLVFHVALRSLHVCWGFIITLSWFLRTNLAVKIPPSSIQISYEIV